MAIDVTQPPYSADNTGATDAREDIQDAINAVAGKGEIYLPSGTYLLGATGPLELPDGAAGLRIVGDGLGNTIVKLTATCPRAFDMRDINPGPRTFQNITLEDLTVDADYVCPAQNNHVLLGNLVSSSWRPRLSFADIAVRRCETMRVATPTAAYLTPTTGGSLAADTYHLRVVSLFGSGQVVGGENAATVGTNGAIDLSIPNLLTPAGSPAATQYRVYVRTQAGGTLGYFAVTPDPGPTTTDTYSGQQLSSAPAPAQSSYQSISIAGRPDTGATTRTVTDIEVEDCRFVGSTGVAILGAGADATIDVYLDRIHLTNVRHDTGVLPAAVHNSGNQIGGLGYGGSCVVRDCEFARAHDVGLEIDTMTEAIVETTVTVDCWNEGFLARNFHAAPDPSSQVAVFRDCHARIADLVPNQGTNLSHGWVLSHSSADASQVFGHAILEDCTYTCEAPSFTVQSGTAVKFQLCPIEAVTIRGLTVIHADVADTSGSQAQTPTLVFGFPETNCTVEIEGLRTVVEGTCGSGMAPRHIQLGAGAAGVDVACTLSGIRVEQTLTGLGNGQTVVCRFGNGMDGGTYSVLLDDLRLVRWSGDTQPKVYYFDPNTRNDVSARGVLLRSGDHSRRPSTGGLEISGPAPPASDNTPDSVIKPKIRLGQGYVLGSTQIPRAPAAISVTGTPPFVYRNLDYFDQLVVVGAPGATQIEVSRDGTSYVNVQQTAGSFHLRQGDYLKVSYQAGVSPPLTKVPLT